MKMHVRAHVFGDDRFDHELIVLFVEQNATGRDLADVNFVQQIL